MATVILSFSMSLDGFVAGPDISDENAMGVGGEALHDWIFKSGAERAVDAEMAAELGPQIGAVVLGRRTFDVGLRHWGDTPWPAPSFVVTHRGQPELPMKSAAFTFVTEGVEAAVRQAAIAAGERMVIVMGAETARQCLAAGLVDEIYIQLVPILLGGGARLFDEVGPAAFDMTRSLASPAVTHLRFQVPKAPGSSTLA